MDQDEPVPTVPAFALTARIPFPGFKHLGGPLAGGIAGLLGGLVAWMDPRTPPIAVCLCTVGALNAYLLSLINRSLRGTVLATAGGFVLGLFSFVAAAGIFPNIQDPSLPIKDADLLMRVFRPFLFLALVPLLGTGPVVLAALGQVQRPRGLFVRLFIPMLGAGLGTLAGLVVFGMFRSLLEWMPETAVYALALATGNYFLFRFQVACLLEESSGDHVQRPALEQPDENAPRPAPATGGDDEP